MTVLGVQVPWWSQKRVCGAQGCQESLVSCRRGRRQATLLIQGKGASSWARQAGFLVFLPGAPRTRPPPQPSVASPSSQEGPGGQGSTSPGDEAVVTVPGVACQACRALSLEQSWVLLINKAGRWIALHVNTHQPLPASPPPPRVTLTRPLPPGPPASASPHAPRDGHTQLAALGAICDDLCQVLPKTQEHSTDLIHENHSSWLHTCSLPGKPASLGSVVYLTQAVPRSLGFESPSRPRAPWCR